MFLPSAYLPALAPQAKTCEKHKQHTKTENTVTTGRNAKGNNQTDIIRVRGVYMAGGNRHSENFTSVVCEAKNA